METKPFPTLSLDPIMSRIKITARMHYSHADSAKYHCCYQCSESASSSKSAMTSNDDDDDDGPNPPTLDSLSQPQGERKRGKGHMGKIDSDVRRCAAKHDVSSSSSSEDAYD